MAAGLNIAEWTPDQVAEWMSGLGPTVAQYVPTLRERGLDGTKLLTLRCDDLEYLGVHIIGHQELLLEAVEHLRNFQYEVSRECVQQLALRVSVVGTTLARALAAHADARLETHTLADVARTVHAVKPLVCWLDRWALGAGALAERKAALLTLALEAATCAQRDRFAEQPARAVAAAAAAAAATADYIIQDVSDPMILQPASVDAVTLRQGGRPLGFEVVPSFCGHHQLADIRFGSPAHASGAVHVGDEIVQVGAQCVIGWSGAAVRRACGAAGPELALRLRRRPPPPLPAPPHRHRRLLHHHPHPHHPLPVRRFELDTLRSEERTVDSGVSDAGAGGGGGEGARAPPDDSSSDDSEPLSPPASPTHLHLDHTGTGVTRGRVGHAGLALRPGRAAPQRRHSVGGGSPPRPRALHQFWQELKEHKWENAGGAGAGPAPDDTALYARDKAVSCSTGLELAPRPHTCLGAPPARVAALPARADGPPARTDAPRGKLDKSHSTPAYDFDTTREEPGSLVAQIIPESPTTPTDSPTILVHSAEKADQILDFKKSSSQIGEAILHQQNRRGGDDRSDGDPAPLPSTFPPHENPNASDHSTEGVADSPDSSLLPEMCDVGRAHDTDGDGQGLDVAGSGERDESTTEKILETINIAMMEHRRRSILELRPTAPRRPSEEAGRGVGPGPGRGEEAGDGAGRERDEHGSCAPRYPYLRSVSIRSSRSDAPPEPPPRPPATQRAAAPSPAPSPGSGPAPGPTSDHIPFPVLRVVPRGAARSEPASPLKPLRPIDAAQISVPLRHITKHDIRVIPSERRDLPALNSEPEGAPAAGPATLAAPSHIVMGAHAADTRLALSPTSTVRGMFPSSKNRSLKKKSSILAKRRSVPARALAARGAAGGVWQRVRARGAMQPRWARRHLLLTHNLLYAYRTPECSKADCMIYLEGCTVSAAGEVKSRAHAFKVYHTGTAFYFACDSRDAMLAWIQLIHRATLLPSLATHTDISKQFSETDYSENESDNESPEKRSEKEKEKDKDKDKDKSKFGSLKKLTHRMQRSESQENVSHSSTSLDRKYLRFFSRNKSNKDDSKASKSKQSGVPVPTEHYRSYRRVTTLDPHPPAPPTPTPDNKDSSPFSAGDTRASKKIPKPINYIHASNPNLLDFEKSDFVTKPTLQVPKPKPKPETLVGFVTLEQFMLKKQEEERRQVYTNRVLMGVERTAAGQRRHELQQRLDDIVPDVIYGEVGAGGAAAVPLPVLELQARSLPAAPSARGGPPAGPQTGTRAAPPVGPRAARGPKPVSVKGSDGYEKIVYREEAGESPPRRSPPPPPTPDRWRDSLRRNDKVHSDSGHTLKSAPSAHPHALAPAHAPTHTHTRLPHAHDSWGGAAVGAPAGVVGAEGEAAAGAGGVSRLRLVFGARPRDVTRQYPHLQCPPTFQPESYSLARAGARRGGERDARP